VKKYKKKKRMGRNAKKRVHTFFLTPKKTFLGWDDVLDHWTFLDVRHSWGFPLTATSYMAMQTRPICIIENGPFSRNNV
jgi:hypothetical protein